MPAVLLSCRHHPAEGPPAPPKVATVSTRADRKPKFIAIDFETANNCKDSACAIGVAVVENDVITQSFQRLIRPPTDYFAEWNFRTHGIHWQDVKNETDFPAVWDDLRRMTDEAAYLVAHNAGFDQEVLAACCDFYGIEPPSTEFLCTIEVASSLWPLDSYALPRVCEFLSIPLVHHNAQSDATASAKILLRAEEQGCDFTDLASAGVASWAAKHLSGEIMDMVTSLMEDGEIEPDEIRTAADWMEANHEAAFVWPGIELKRHIDDILQDGTIAEQEIDAFRELCCTLLGLRDRKKSRHASRKKPGALAVCFTGFGPRKAELRAEAEAAGYHVAGSITKSLDFLVCGPSPGPSKLEQAAKRGIKALTLNEWRAVMSRPPAP